MNLPQIENDASVNHRPEALTESQVKACFLQTIRHLFLANPTDPEGFLAYFTERAPRDEEILGLLSIATNLAASPLIAFFPTSFEALASLPEADRSDLCQAFRNALAASNRKSAAA
ncbi:MAG: hypothetical protein ACRD3T_15115 [Terriglobia bacterium]